jgi:hypothetical protein
VEEDEDAPRREDERLVGEQVEMQLTVEHGVGKKRRRG